MWVSPPSISLSPRAVTTPCFNFLWNSVCRFPRRTPDLYKARAAALSGFRRLNPTRLKLVRCARSQLHDPLLQRLPYRGCPIWRAALSGRRRTQGGCRIFSDCHRCPFQPFHFHHTASLASQPAQHVEKRYLLREACGAASSEIAPSPDSLSQANAPAVCGAPRNT